MDANGLRFWMLADKDQWTLVAPEGQRPGAQYDKERRALRLASRRLLEGLSDSNADKAGAEAKLELIPQAIDSFGTRAFLDDATGKVMATGALPGEVTIYTPPVGEAITDLATGYDGVLYIAVAGRVVMQDLRDRWDAVTVEAQDFEAWRLAADPGGGVWVLDRVNKKVARAQGSPRHRRPFALYSTDTFRPCEENPDPPRLTVVKSQLDWPDARLVAIACSPKGRVALLGWSALEDESSLCLLDADNELSPPMSLAGAHYPYSLAWLSDDRVAVLLNNLAGEAVAYPVGEYAQMLEPAGDLYPLRDHTGEPFLNGVSLPPHYPARSLDPKTNKQVWASSPLHRLSLPSFAGSGMAANSRSLDSGSTQTVWHRIYIEAFIPANCGVKVYLAASDDQMPPDEADADNWHEHRFGEMFAQASDRSLPRGAWVSAASEVPFHAGLLHCPREANRSGLFTALIQRATRRVRTMSGRYIHVRVELSGDGRATPELAAVRLYASRFSYLNRYLPELYREAVFGEEADRIVSGAGASTAADFLERFLDNLEGILTPLEDRIANAYLLTDPRTTPEDALEWLGSWIGVTFDPAYPPSRRRRLIESAPELYRKRGTLDGLKLALDVVTGGAVAGGEIVVIEDFRLRRTFATILGADLADEDDPLLAGVVASGNSFVGDTLFLGDEEKREFLALFNADLPVTIGEEEAIESLFDRLAHRVTVLVHQEVEPQNLGLIRRVAELETPADVVCRVQTATHPFMVAVASLIGVDTYMAVKLLPQPVEVGRSRVGERDFLQGLASLDPRLERSRA
jgi:phage tail-like protein